MKTRGADNLQDNLRRRRRSLKLSQADLAARSGIRQQYLSELERGLRPTDSTHLKLLARALRVPQTALERQVK